MTDNHDYLAVPESGGGPGLLVLHAWWGLTDFYKKLSYQLGGQAFVVLAPDLFDGVTTDDRDKADELASQKILAGETINHLKRAVETLQAHPAVTKPQIGLVGFSLGGFWALELVANHKPKDIGAVVSFYGNHPGIEVESLTQTQAAFLGHFAESDEFDSFDEVLQMQEKIRQAGKTVTFHQYPGTQHWFAESNVPQAYNAEATKLAWGRTFEFLKDTLK